MALLAGSIVQDRIGVISVDSPPVNALSTAVRSGIATSLAECLANEAVDAIVLICKGRTFFAGADISEMGKPPELPTLHDVMHMIEDASKPVIAAIHGSALGGGLETALVCHYRIATRSAHVGLPEVHLGLLPGGGGTQRLPRLIGPERALDLMIFGRTLTSGEAAELGILDRLVSDDALLEEAVAFAQEIVQSDAVLRRVRDLDQHTRASGANPDLFDAFRREHAALMRGYKAPAHIVSAVEAAVTLPFDEGMDREWALFRELEDSAESAAQRHIFFAEREAAKVPGIGRDIKPRPIRSVMCVGPAGAWPALLQEHGLEVRCYDDWTTALRNGVAGLAHYDLVLETSPQMLLTGPQLAELEGCKRPDALLAVSQVKHLVEGASQAVHPESLLALSLYPAGSRLLEIVRGAATAPKAVAAVLALSRKLGKVAVTSQAGSGFLVERLIGVRDAALARLRADGVSDGVIGEALAAFGFANEDEGTSGGVDVSIIRPALQAVAEEGALMLDQGAVSRASDIDVAAVLATGWPIYRGGPMFWADRAVAPTASHTKDQS